MDVATKFALTKVWCQMNVFKNILVKSDANRVDLELD